jgi:hypothetical protein
VGDVCTTGVCSGVDLCAGVVCAASDSCHDVGTCDWETGICSNPAKQDAPGCGGGDVLVDACTNDLECTGGRVCVQSVCQVVPKVPAAAPIHLLWMGAFLCGTALTMIRRRRR